MVDKFSWDLLLFCKNGHFDEARRLFSCMPCWSLVSFTTMISVDSKRSKMQGIQSVTINAVLFAFAENGHLDSAKVVFSKMPAHNLVSWTMMLGALSQLADVESTFKEMPEHDVVSCTCAIAAFSRHGHLELFHAMQSCDSRRRALPLLHPGARPCPWSDDALGSLTISAWGVEEQPPFCRSLPDNPWVSEICLLFLREFNSRFAAREKWFDAVTRAVTGHHSEHAMFYFAADFYVPWNSMALLRKANEMINSNAKMGILKDYMMPSYVLAPADHVSPAATSMNPAAAREPCLDLEKCVLLIKSSTTIAQAKSTHSRVLPCLKHFPGSQAKYVFDEMPQRSPASWTAMLVSCARSGYLGDAEDMYKYMPFKDIVAKTSILVAYAQLGHLAKALKIFSEMPRADQICWNAMLSAHTRNGNLMDARRFFKSMPARNLSSWTTMLLAYSQAGHLLGASYIFDSMPYRDMVCWNAMFTAFSIHGCLEEARGMFEVMPERDLVSFNGMLCGFVYNFARDLEHEMVEESRKLFDSMPERDHVLDEHDLPVWPEWRSGKGARSI
ncbi:pentatricopeptide repeat-containing protein At1g09410, mitochondrial [Selaginella moellendorffii]|uniref:pentatricopeptide repeat-containing protein At1g09410, mitochondrial n=1 Tax=Selaginella moellendorffii TaxID=88036 RepID=UPI000D1C7F4D|nr:pentatricopeptide repeat-containing protein At1g09410, mitochondrial [Selaginella moellendorffii]|eukprot:XP_024532525.1 pentatricopeptide repeat-containing protein At1g09410, mitochondrial [Selaginella moellendorffii]